MKRALASFLLLLALPLQAAKIPVSGRVVDTGGKPVPNARVALIPVPPEAERGRLDLAVQTDLEPASKVSADTEGVYRLEAPDSGIWRVKVEAPGFVPLQTLLAPLVEEANLPEATLLRDARLQVKLTDGQGKPVAGARVRVTDQRPVPSAPVMWQTAVRLAATDANGSATLPRGAEERILVQAGAPGLVPAQRNEVRGGSVSLQLAAGRTRRLQVRDPQGKAVPGVLVVLAGGAWRLGRTSEDGLLDLVLPDARGADLRLVAEDGRSLAFRLPDAKPEDQEPVTVVLPPLSPASGKVASEQDGRPLPGALVWRMDDLGAWVRAGADGTFRIPATTETKSVSAGAAGFFPGQAAIEGGRAATLSLEPKLAVSGVVVDESGRPVAGAEITATFLPSPRMLARPSEGSAGGLARSGESGRFRLGTLGAGIAYELKVRKAGFAPARMELPAREAGQPAQDLRIVLRAGRTAFGVVLDAGRQPVAGARVTLQPSPPTGLAARSWASRNPPERFEGATGPTGRFELASLPAGTYDLTVRSRGFAPLTVPGLALPEEAGRTDLGTVVLSPGVAVRGLVTDPKGNPVAGAEVRAKAAERRALPKSSSTFDPRDPGAAEAVTAQDGTFLLEDRAPGEPLDLTVRHPRYAQGSAPGVAAPTETPVRIVLQPTLRVSGRVTDPDGKPIAGAKVNLSELQPVSFPGGHTSLLSKGPTRRVVTDEKGAFRIDDVPPGPIQIQAEAPRRQRAQVDGLEVKPGQDLTNVEIVLTPGGAVEGRVLSAEGRPVPGAQVRLVEVERRPGMLPAMALADGDGRYRLDGVPPGPRTLEATAEGYRRGVREVEATADTRTADFELERGLEVSGRVVDGAGDPVASANVALMVGNDIWNAQHGITGADGAFRLSGIGDGTYVLMARKDGYVTDYKGQTVTVAGVSLGGLEIRLSAGATITGRIIGIEFSQLSRVRVWANWEGNLGRVDPDGVYRISNLQPGDFTVTAVVPGTPLHAEGRVTIEPGTPEARLDLQLGHGHGLTGVVLRNGQPLAGASVGLGRGGLYGSHDATTDHQGGFRFGGLEAGTYDLAVGTPNGARHRESVEISGDREVRVELRTASLTGRVIDATDLSPLSGARVSLASADGRTGLLPQVTTDGQGRFRLIEVAAGPWKLKIYREGYAPGEREIQVEGSGDQIIEIRLTPAEFR